MLRVNLYSVALLAALSPVAYAADTKSEDDKDQKNKSIHATISKIDSQKHTLTVNSTDDKGKKHEKTLQLTSDVKYLNAMGKEAKADTFKSGDDVCLHEKDGKVTEIRKESELKITKVDRKSGTITVQMTDDKGKEVERMFRLIEESEIIDSTGRLTLMNVFQSGDDILFLEADARIKSVNKSDEKNAKAEAKQNNDKTKDKH